VDKALQHAKPDLEDRLLGKQRDDLCLIDELQDLFRSIDLDKSSTLTLSELRTSLKDLRILSFFDLQGLSVKDVEMFFKLLTQVADTSEIDMESFVSGCLRMKGYATNLDIFTMLYQTRALGDKTMAAIKQCMHEMQQLRSDLTGRA